MRKELLRYRVTALTSKWTLYRHRQQGHLQDGGLLVCVVNQLELRSAGC